MINVTKPNLPILSDYVNYLQSIWERNWLTNNGPLVNELELNLKNYLKLDHLLYLNNGTIAIQLALKALNLPAGSEIITTPFSYIATASSVVWEGFKPVFVDIDPLTYNINPKEIANAITPKTSAILATHVFGNSCDVDSINKIAKENNLKVIYDAAHAFGTTYKGKSIFSYGDISTTSFHATKLFHTIEGGAVFTEDAKLLKVLAHMRNFGHDGPDDFNSVGINGKNSEFHAAMGLCNLKVVDNILHERRWASLLYDNKLTNSGLTRPMITNDTEFNYAYYAVTFPSNEVLLKTINALNGNYIYPRRYFYPSLNKVNYLQGQTMPISEDISSRILCLPLYKGMTEEEIDFVTRIILRSLKF